MAELPGKQLAQDLIQKSRGESRRTPMEAVIQLAKDGQFHEEQGFRLLGQLWVLERLFYYIYGGWGQGLEVNDFPPAVKYLFAKQILDESSQEMVYLDTLLRKGWVRTQREAFQHPYSKFVMDSRLSSYAFSLRYLATYPHTVRIAALNLGPKILELSWMEGLAEVLSDEELRGVFTSQFVENRSHVNMGRRIIEEYVNKSVEGELCRRACETAKRDYRQFLEELSNFILGQEVKVEVRELFRVE